MTTPRKAQKAATRRQLKEAALSCFTDEGLTESSVAAITRRAGVAHGTFYVHFPSKEALLDELLADFNEELVGRLAPIWREMVSAELESVVRHTAEVFLDAWQDHRPLVEVYATRLSQGVSLIQLRDGINPQVAELLTERLAARVGATGEPVRLAAHGLLALWARVGLQALFDDDVSRHEALEVLVSMTLGALGALWPR